MSFFLTLFYVLFCEGFMVGTLMDNDEISEAAKILLAIFAVISAPIFLGGSLGLIIFEKLNRK